jgi:integrase
MFTGFPHIEASGRANLAPEAASASREEFERMARRRFQQPKPELWRNHWWLRVWQDQMIGGTLQRKRVRIKLGPATMLAREAAKVAAEYLRPVNQGLISAGGAVPFNQYVETIWMPTELPLLSSSTQNCYQGIIAKCLEPRFGASCLRELSPLVLQRYFSELTGERVGYPTVLKIRDTLSSILRSAARFGFIVTNPMVGLKLPVDKRPRRQKPVITPQQLSHLVELIEEPYASAVFVAAWTGLRVSELLALKWGGVHANSISISERYCRGDWSQPKTKASAATIAVAPQVIHRILRLKGLVIEVRAGVGTRKYQAVKSSGSDDLVFQAIQTGGPMHDQNILKRHVQPAARKLGLHVDWRMLRRSHATWMVRAGGDVKSVQAQMRHSRISTTMEVYCQTMAEGQREAIEKFAEFACPIGVPKNSPLQ